MRWNTRTSKIDRYHQDLKIFRGLLTRTSLIAEMVVAPIKHCLLLPLAAPSVADPTEKAGLVLDLLMVALGIATIGGLPALAIHLAPDHQLVDITTVAVLPRLLVDDSSGSPTAHAFHTRTSILPECPINCHRLHLMA
jgi:hypothetical protein